MARPTRRYGNGTAAASAILLIGAGLALAWLIVAPMVLGTGGPALSGPLAEAGEQQPQTDAAPLMEGVRVAGNFQTSQPRDPFKPLITEDAQAGVTPQPPAPADGEPADGFAPVGKRVTLVEIREVDGTLRATVTVDGTSYDVGEGDTFAGNFKVVSLEKDRGVFLFGDNAFELAVGQAILK